MHPPPKCFLAKTGGTVERGVWHKQSLALCVSALGARKVPNHAENQLTLTPGWTFRIFLMFFCSGEGKGESEAPGSGGGRFFLLKIPGGGGGGGSTRRVRGARGWEGVDGEFGGGAKYFFSGPNFPPRFFLTKRVGISLAIYRGQKASPWETPKKVGKGVPGPLGPRVKKGSKKSRK